MESLSINRIDIDEVDSTNNYIKNLISSGFSLPGFTLAVTQNQTAGKFLENTAW